MTVRTVIEKLGFQEVQAEFEDRELASAYTSDLLSDVMANAGDADILITIQAHKNTVAVATLIGVAAIIVCNNRPIPEDMIEAARSEQIGILVTNHDQFTVSGLIYQDL